MRMAIAIVASLALSCGSDDSEREKRDDTPRASQPAQPKGPCPSGTELYKREATGSPTVTGCRKPNGDFHGPYKVELGETLTAEGKFENGKRHGDWIYRHPNGKTWKQGRYVQGRLDGEWKEFSKAGKLLGTYTLKNGTGREITWWDNGNKRQEVDWKNGVRHGITSSYFETGEKMMEATWEGGKVNGTWTFWDVKGQTRKVETWKDGIIENTVWYEQGVPITE